LSARGRLFLEESFEFFPDLISVCFPSIYARFRDREIGHNLGTEWEQDDQKTIKRPIKDQQPYRTIRMSWRDTKIAQ
jgi:hypothetical protein